MTQTRFPGSARSRAVGILTRFVSDRSGASAVVIALAMTGLLGMTGLGTEVGMWYVSKRTMHSAADSAAYSAALANYNGESKSQYTSEAKSITGNYGFVDGTGGVVVTVNSPPATGNYTANAKAVEVIISQPQPLVLSGLFLGKQTTAAARAVAITGTAGSPGNGCVVALNGASITDIFNQGTTNVNLIGCDIYDNSPSGSALTVVGDATISANGAYIVGNYSTSGGGTFTTKSVADGGDGTNVNWGSPAVDPFAGDLAGVNPPNTCTYTKYKVNSGATIPASTFTSGQMFCGSGGQKAIDITGNSTVNFPAGVFYVKDGDLHVGGGSKLNAPNGTTFVLLGTATVTFDGGAIVNVVASSTGPFPGVAFAIDTPAGAGTSSFLGGTTMTIAGAVYAPNNSIAWAGGSNSSGTPCTQVVAQTIDFKGNAVFGTNCTGYGFPNAGIGKTAGTVTKLVE
jgi:Flp pilus assembly protein TadG